MLSPGINAAHFGSGAISYSEVPGLSGKKTIYRPAPVYLPNIYREYKAQTRPLFCRIFQRLVLMKSEMVVEFQMAV
jgi:hypothetical protein